MVADQSEPLAGKYRLVRQLGQGGMGSVWQAEHVTLHAMVAIKLLDPMMAQTKDGLNRFLREAQAAASLRSPHIVQILDHGIDRGTPYIAMELLEGESLGSRLDRALRLSPTETARIITHVARAMTRAHEAGIVHRDLKPDNIFLVPNDDEEVVKVLDFGIAKLNQPLTASMSDSTRTGTMLGTPYYMSPEQVESATNADYRTDIWALGIIAYQCIIGRRPFEAETIGGLFLAICSKQFPVPSQRGPVPPGFDAWFARACARDPAQRFTTAREAAAELKRVCAFDPYATTSFDPNSAQSLHEGPAAFGNTTGQRSAVGYSSPPSNSRRRIGLVVALVSAVLLGAAASAWKVLTPADSVDKVPSASPKPVTAASPSPAATEPAIAIEPAVPAPSAPASVSAKTAPTLRPRPKAGPLSTSPAKQAPAAPASRPTPQRPNVDLGL